MLVGLTGRPLRGQAVREYLDSAPRVNVILNVENVEGVANGKAAILTGSFTATFTSAREVRGTLVQLYENEGVWKPRALIASRFAPHHRHQPVGRKMIVAGRRMLQRAVTLVESRAEESPWLAVTGVRARVSDPFHSIG